MTINNNTTNNPGSCVGSVPASLGTKECSIINTIREYSDIDGCTLSDAQLVEFVGYLDMFLGNFGTFCRAEYEDLLAFVSDYLDDFRHDDEPAILGDLVAQLFENDVGDFGPYVADGSEILAELYRMAAPLSPDPDKDPSQCQGGSSYTISENPNFGSVEVSFSGKPSEAVRDALKAHGFRWNGKRRLWYGFQGVEAVRAFLSDASGDLVIPDPVAVDPGTLYEGWEGCHARDWHHDSKELKKYLLEDFKRAGVKASVRFHSGGYHTSLTVTLSVKPEEIKSFEEFRASSDLHILPGRWYGYRDESGEYRDIFGASFYSLDPNSPETQDLRARIERYAYDSALHSFGSSNDFRGQAFSELLKPEALRRLRLVGEIIDSYNHDCSNSQVDYFDRWIYDHYSIKIA